MKIILIKFIGIDSCYECDSTRGDLNCVDDFYQSICSSETSNPEEFPFLGCFHYEKSKFFLTKIKNNYK